MFFRNKFVPILTYHNICENTYQLKGCNDWISENELKSQLEFIKAQHFTPIFLNQLLKSKKELPQNPIILTFDDGYESCYSRVFPLLKEFNFKASFFIFTNFIGETPENRQNNDWNIGYRPKTRHLVWTEITEMVNSGLVEIGSHTQSHKSLTNLNLDEVNKELAASKEIIDHYLKSKTYIFSYPGGHGYNNDEIRNLILKNGYIAAVSAFPPELENINKMDILAIKRIEINQMITSNFKEKSLAKNKLICQLHPLLFFVSKFNTLNWLANLLVPFYNKNK